MGDLSMIIHKIKGIDHGIIDIPLENGVFAIVGNNGSGKSTIMSCLAQLISRHNLGLLRKEDHTPESYVEFISNDRRDKWYCADGFWKTDSYPRTIRYNGTYEGSLFYGVRFKDSKNVDELMEQGKILSQEVVNADAYITEQMGSILHGDKLFYPYLKRIRNKMIAEKLALKNTPYFIDVNGNLISQYRMSSGECLLISLLHFIYNSIIRRSLPAREPILMLIDEIELALHPMAVAALLDLLKDLTANYNNLTVILTSHSPELIRRIPPKNIYKLEPVNNPQNSLDIINPCYPSYAIRDIYAHDGFDYLLLVEDDLAKIIVNQAIETLHLYNSRLINVLPVGGWRNVLSLQYELISKNILGIKRNVFSILDGDIQSEVGGKYKNVKKLFLPVNSIEKFLLNVLINKKNIQVKRSINDKFFNIESLDSILAKYKEAERMAAETLADDYRPDTDGKRLYSKLLKSLQSISINEETFVRGIYEIVNSCIDFTKFHEQLKASLTIGCGTPA